MPKIASVSQVSEEQLLHTSASEMKDTQTGILKDADAPFVPTVTAVASAPDLKWMVLSTDISSVSPCRHEKSQSSSPSTDANPARKTFTGRRKGVKDQLSPEEEERKRIRRERNKLAAAKCRNRRQELTNSLQAETDSLEEDKAALQSEIASLLKEKEQLELILSAHKPYCKLTEETAAESEEQTQAQKEQIQARSTSPEQVPTSPQQADPTSTAIFGDSDILLCSSAELGAAEVEPYIDMQDVSMEDISEVIDSGDDMDLLVPDIDLTSSLGLSEWETLYMSMGGGLEALSSPTCSPTCSSTNAVPVFSFNNADVEKHDSGKEVKSNAAKEISTTL
ncbi:proto-oncogene c-Fos isoform X2 [Sinocyclocheilus anshuiensis]|uniref:Proto-oncogene c-Fos-like n=1 Tax=Sinocyclocheilus anshuiensis TaxID=1608454 RepID=A0A671S2G0_9TELE|nr:PREDICTED: proto-oncogene c-Fos-like isoform X2 [Sinocyclocheilus anshuiensis]